MANNVRPPASAEPSALMTLVHGLATMLMGTKPKKAVIEEAVSVVMPLGSRATGTLRIEIDADPAALAQIQVQIAEIQANAQAEIARNSQPSAHH